METITMLIVALTPAFGTLCAIIALVGRICKRFADLRAEVKDDKTMNALLENNERLTELYAATVKDVKELSKQVDTLRKTSKDLADNYNIDTDKLLQEVVRLKDELARLVQDNKELQKNLTFTVCQAPNNEED